MREKTQSPHLCLSITILSSQASGCEQHAFFTRLLSWGEPQLTPCYFDMDVLQRYYDDPRYHFYFKDYSGSISFKEKDGESMVRNEDEVFLQSFGLGYDNNRTRIVVVYLRYLNDLTPEHQNYWQSKMVHPNLEPRILDEYYENRINGNYVTSKSVYSAFQCEVNAVIDLSQQIFGEPLFREKISLKNPPKELSLFFLPTRKNFYAFALAMDQMISENINRDFFSGKVVLEAEVMMDIDHLFAPHGTAYFTVCRDLTKEGSRFHPIYRRYTYQCNV